MEKTNKLAQEIAERLLAIEAVVLRPDQPFTWSSGWKSPIYCDNRLTISYPKVREQIAEGFVSLIRERHPDCEVIAGAATGGIPHAAWVADKLGLPMIYVRDKPKGHGKENMIEGVLKPGQKVVVVEDLISTGGSSLRVAKAVNEAGAKTLSVISIFTYQFAKADEMFGEAGIPFDSLTNYSVAIEAAIRMNKVREEELALLKSWRESPETFGQ